MIIEVPVKAHVKQFLTNKKVWGDEPLKARANNPIGKAVIAVLCQYPIPTAVPRKKMKEQIVDEIQDEKFHELFKNGVYLRIKLTFQLNEEFITDDNLIRLGELLEDQFENSLKFFVEGRMDRLPSEQGAVKRFYQLYDIDPEKYDFDAAFKIVRRRLASKD